jgi:hypothetical protein
MKRTCVFCGVVMEDDEHGDKLVTHALNEHLGEMDSLKNCTVEYGDDPRGPIITAWAGLADELTKQQPRAKANWWDDVERVYTRPER